MSGRVDTVVRPGSGVVFRRLQVGKGGVLLKLETGAYHSLNETGALLWELMADGRTLNDVTAEFRNAVDESPTELEVAVRDFFSQLNRRDLVEMAAPDQEATGPSGP